MLGQRGGGTRQARKPPAVLEIGETGDTPAYILGFLPRTWEKAVGCVWESHDR